MYSSVESKSKSIDTIGKEAEIFLQELEREMPPTSSLPYSTEHKTMLLDYIDSALACIRPRRDDVDQITSDANFRRNLSRKRTFESSLEETYPEIISHIKRKCAELDKKNKYKKIADTFLNYNQEKLLSLNDSELQKEYLEAVRFEQMLTSLNKIFHYLCCERGGLSTTISVYYSQSGKIYQDSKEALGSLVFTIQTPSEAIGYSIHNLLVISGLLPMGSVYAGNNGNGPLFQFTYQDLVKLKTYMSDLLICYQDFAAVLSALFGENAEQYIKTGYKPVSEVVKTELVRQEKRETLLINPKVIQRLQAHPNQAERILLFAQPAVDLNSHPHRDEMRQLMEWIYKINGLTDSKLDAKTFIREESGAYQYVSLLSIEQVRLIFRDLMFLCYLTNISQEAGFSSLFDYVSLLGLLDARSLYHQYLFIRLLEINLQLEPPTHEELLTRRRRLEVHLNTLFPAPKDTDTLSMTYDRFKELVKKLLNQNTGIICRPVDHNAALEATDDERRALLPERRPHPTLIPQDAADINSLCTKLKTCAVYDEAENAYAEYYRSMGAHSLASAGNYFDPTLIYMYPTLNECVDALAEEFKRRMARHDNSAELELAKQVFMNAVTKMCYQTKMHIPLSSVKNAARRFADILKVDGGLADLKAGCNTGFAGRCIAMESQLISLDEDGARAANKQLLVESVEQSFFDTVATLEHIESSQSASLKPELLHALGLEARLVGPDRSFYAPRRTAFMKDLVTRYNPGSVYEICYQTMLDNFKNFARDDNDASIYQLLASLGVNVESEADRNEINRYFRIGNKWSVSKFQEQLPERLIQKLLSENILHKEADTRGLLRVGLGEKYSFSEEIADKNRRMAEAASRRTPAGSASSLSQTWGNGPNLFSFGRQVPPTATDEQREAVRDVTTSSIARTPNSGSTS